VRFAAVDADPLIECWRDNTSRWARRYGRIQCIFEPKARPTPDAKGGRIMQETRSDESQPCPCGVILVGSVPLSDAESVFRMAAQQLGRHVKRLPDGETGSRSHWIAWQLDVFKRTAGLLAETVATGYVKRERFRVKPGIDPASIRFPALGYADAAIASWRTFDTLQVGSHIDRALKFQVCLPTPLAPIQSYLFPEAQAALEPAYEAAMLAELDRILAAIPHERLAIQWDTAIEFAVLEGVMPSFLADPEGGILERLTRLGNCVPADVQLGFHLCYGDAGHRHFKEPEDAGKLVRVANHLARSLRRSLDWLHLPVPRNRDDDVYFRPLADLRMSPSTEIYLGLVHLTDGVEGTLRRIAAARPYLPRFGVGTECGMGRRPPDTIASLMALHSQVAAPLAA